MKNQVVVKKAGDPSLGGDLNESQRRSTRCPREEGLAWTVEAEWLAGTSRHRHGKTRGYEKSKYQISRETKKKKKGRSDREGWDKNEIEDWRIGGLRRRGGEKDSASNDVSFFPSPRSRLVPGK